MQIARWLKFTKSQQIGAIGAEITRAKTWQGKDKDSFLSAIERAINLTDFSLEDNRWSSQRSMLFGLRDELAKLYAGISKMNLETLLNAL